MAIVKIPMADYSNFSVDTVLDGIKFTFDFVWNSRGSFWSMSIYDANGNVLINGIRLVCYYLLLSQYQYNRSLPQGFLQVIDPNQATARQEPTRYDFVKDRNLELCYVEVS